MQYIRILCNVIYTYITSCNIYGYYVYDMPFHHIKTLEFKSNVLVPNNLKQLQHDMALKAAQSTGANTMDGVLRAYEVPCVYSI